MILLKSAFRLFPSVLVVAAGNLVFLRPNLRDFAGKKTARGGGATPEASGHTGRSALRVPRHDPMFVLTDSV